VQQHHVKVRGTNQQQHVVYRGLNVRRRHVRRPNLGGEEKVFSAAYSAGDGLANSLADATQISVHFGKVEVPVANGDGCTERSLCILLKQEQNE